MNDNTRTDKSGTPISVEDISEVDGVSAPALRVVSDDTSDRAQARAEARRRRSQVEHPTTWRWTKATAEDFPAYTPGTDVRTYLGQAVDTPITPQSTDIDVAYAVATVASKVVRHDGVGDTWWAWDGTRWTPSRLAGQHAVVDLCGETDPAILPWRSTPVRSAEKATETAVREGFAYELDGAVYDVETDKPFMPVSPARVTSAKAVKDIASLVRSYAGVDPSEFDADRRILATPTAHINLETMETTEPLPTSMNTKVTSAKLDLTALDGSRFVRFVEEILPDPAVRDYVQKVMGTALDPTIHLRILPTFVGEGNNGKSVLLDSVINAIGGENDGTYGCVLSQKVVQGGTNDHLSKLMPLKGARIAIVSETEKGGKWNDNTLKSLSGGDAITANWMAQNPVTFQPTHTLFLATNNRPVIPAGAQAFWNRYREITFPMHYTSNPVKPNDRKIDLGLKEELRTEKEMSAILAWLLEGLVAYRDEGLTTPDAVLEASREAKSNANPFAIFAGQTFEVVTDATEKAPSSAVYAMWDMYKLQNSSFKFQAPNSVQAVSDLQYELDGVTYEDRRNGKDYAGFWGLRLTEDGQELARDVLASGIKISRAGMRWLQKHGEGIR